MNEVCKRLVVGLRNKLVVSCQIYPDEPIRRADIIVVVAQSVVVGGASAVRVQGLVDIIAMRQVVEVPIIGLIKVGHDGVYVTPSVARAKACIEAGADIVAIDAALRECGAGETFVDVTAAIHDYFPQSAVMANCAFLEDMKIAEDAGADLIGTVLAGYTPDSYAYSRLTTEGPDLRFIETLCLTVKTLAVVERRTRNPEDLQHVFEFLTHFVCMGTMITYPQRVIGRYTKALP